MTLPFLFTIFLGAQLNDIITQIEELRLLNFKAYPYLYVGTHQTDARHSLVYENNAEAIAVEATKDDKVQALVMGTPVSRLVSDFPDIELVLKQAHFDPQEFYYFEEALISDDIALIEKMYSLVEKHALKLGYKYMCFVSVIEEESVYRPHDYVSKDVVFHYLGFTKTNLTTTCSWPTKSDDGLVEVKEHTLIIWIKKMDYQNDKKLVKNNTNEWTEFSFVLKPSPIAGIGVFATHDIAAGTVLFNQEIRHNVRTLKIKDVPDDLLQYCVYINNEECFAPERFDRMEMGWFINHSATPNIAKKDSSHMVTVAQDFYDNREKHDFYAIKDIKAGDEIVMDYNELNEPEQLKEDYFKK